MEENFPAAERIINDIILALRNAKLKNFQILPVTQNENKSPVHHDRDSLGLESWCVSHVYCYIYNLLMEFKQKRKREDAERIDQLLMVALLLNPEVTLFWNMRRELVNIDPHSELNFTSVILSRKPKSAEVFNYRKWLIKTLLKSFSSEPALVKQELCACHVAAENYSNNYYAWSHRIWCLDQLSPDCEFYISILIKEWMFSHTWVSTHVSDHSGFQYRQYLLEKLIHLTSSGYNMIRKYTADIERSSLWSLRMFSFPEESRSDTQMTDTTKSILSESLDNQCETIESVQLGLVLSEFFFNTDLVIVYPGHEAIWCHRRFILSAFKDLVSNGQFLKCESIMITQKDTNGVSLEKAKRVESVGEMLIQRLIRFETVFYNRCKARKDRQASSAERHRAWLASIMKINLQLPVR